MNYDLDEHKRVMAVKRLTLDLLERIAWEANRASPEVAKHFLAFRDGIDDLVEDEINKGALHLIECAEMDEMPVHFPASLPSGRYR